MEVLCSTRAVKVLDYLERTVPATVSRSSLDELEKVPSRMLTGGALGEVTQDAQLRDWLSTHPLPAPRATVSGPLFQGTLVFARVIFTRPNQPDFAMSQADVQTAVAYATLAVVPIQRYASQYGYASVTVSPTVIPFTAALSGNAFTRGDLEGWVEQIAHTARSDRVASPCVVILHDRSLAATPTFTGERDSYHSAAQDGTPYCYSLVFGENLSVADNNHTINNRPTEKVYAHNLSHEIAEMVVDPRRDEGNPEVCDACAGNCENSQFDLFDRNGVFMGGTTDTASATGFSFFINAVVRAGVPVTPKQCIADTSENQSACVYPPPLAWVGPGLLTTVSNPVSVAGHFSSADQRHLIVVGTSQGKLHEVFWHPAEGGIEGEDDLPVTFGGGTIVSVASMYNVDQNRHVVLVGTTSGKIHEIFWTPETVGIEGQDDLPVPFPVGSIVAVGALYDTVQQSHLAIVATTAGRLHEIYWKADSVGVDGHDDLPVTFAPGSIRALTAVYDSDEQRYVVVVATQDGKLHEIFWKADTAGIEGQDELPVAFGAGPIVDIAGLYDSSRKRIIVAVGTGDGTVHQVYWKAATVGVEAQAVVTEVGQGAIVSLTALYSGTDGVDHIVVALSNGRLEELWVSPDI
jgi:hypothetical protein